MSHGCRASVSSTREHAVIVSPKETMREIQDRKSDFFLFLLYKKTTCPVAELHSEKKNGPHEKYPETVKRPFKTALF